MSLIKGIKRRPLMAVALIVAFVAMGGLGAWYASEPSAEASSEVKQQLRERLHKGIGSEVQFASATARPEQINEAVRSTADFIYWRSGLRISDKTRKKLAAAESNVLKGNVGYITIEALVDNLTAIAVERLATITDEEIRAAADASSDEYGQILSRADGRWGALTKKELIKQAKSGREWSQKGDFALRTSLRSMIEEEVSDRVTKLSAALPEQFGQASLQGVTPIQALLIAYSVAADDPLTDSRSDIEQILIQKRMDSGQTREQKRAQKNVSGRPYGPHGLLHPSAPQLFLNKAAVAKFLNLNEGGNK